MAERQIVETFCTCSSLSSCLFRFWFCFSEKSIWFSCLWYINIYSTVHTYIYVYTYIYINIHIYRILILVCLLCLFRCCLLSLRVCCENIFRQFRWYSFCLCFTHFTCSPALSLSPFLSLHSSLISPEYIKSMFIRYRKCFLCVQKNKNHFNFFFFLLNAHASNLLVFGSLHTFLCISFYFSASINITLS